MERPLALTVREWRLGRQRRFVALVGPHGDDGGPGLRAPHELGAEDLMPRLPHSSEPEPRNVALRWIEDRAHYDFVLRALTKSEVSLWMATANLKDVRFEAPIGSVARARRRYISVTEHFEALLKRGVELRVLHGTQPSGPFKESLAKRRGLGDQHRWLRQCPRVHLKMIAVDGTDLYLGSANLTGAGVGAKGEARRNFELGVTTSDHLLVDAAQRRFDRIWNGRECGACRVRQHCPRPLDDRPHRVAAAG